MMWNEFMEIAGYEVSYETYTNVIEPMYMALPGNITKQEFVKMLDKKAFALKTKSELIKLMKKEAKYLAETCGHYTDYESKQRLDKLAKEFATRFYGYDSISEANGVWYYFEEEYEYPEIMRGCKYPAKLIVCTKGLTHLAEIKLV